MKKLLYFLGLYLTLAFTVSCKKKEHHGANNGCDPGSNNLLLDFAFNASANDLRGNTDSATIYNGFWGTGRNGLANGALLFNGSDCYATIKNVCDIPTRSFSLWFSVNYYPFGAAPTHDLGYIFTLDNDYLTNGYATAYVSGAGGLKTLTLGIGSTDAEIKTQLPDGVKWNHLVFTQDHYSVNMYLNGNKLLSSIIPSYYKSGDAFTNKLILGTTRNINGRYFNGSIDDLRFYDRALTECEVQHLYKN